MTDLSVQLDRSSVPADGGPVRAAIRIQPGMTDEDARRHVAMCIDTSGSMSGEKIEQVRDGVRWTFGYLSDEDYLSIVTFDDEANVVLAATRWGDMTLDEADAIVEKMRPGGGTDILGGLEAAYDTLADLPAGPDVGRRILLLSDGQDETPTATFAEFARRIRREDGIAIPAAGIGEFYDEATIRTVGTASDGEWVHLSQAGDIENFFGRKVETLRTVVAPSPNLEVGLPPGADVGEVLLRQPQVRDANVERTGDAIRVFLPDLLEFETQEVVFTVAVPSCQTGRPLRLAEVTLNTPGDTTTAAVDIECTPVSERGATSQAVADPEVALKQVETMVRKAAGEGDLAAAETMVAQATGEAAIPEEGATKRREDLPAEKATQLRPEGPDDDIQSEADEPVEEVTKIRGDAPEEKATKIRGASPDESGTPGRPEASDHAETWTSAGDDTQVRQDPPEDVATKIRRDTADEGPAGSGGAAETETRLQPGSVTDLSGLVDDEHLSELRTVVESTAEDDLEDQYETTMIRDTEGR